MNNLPIESFTNSELVKLKNDLEKRISELEAGLSKNINDINLWSDKIPGFYTLDSTMKEEAPKEINSLSSVLQQVITEIEERKANNLFTDEDHLTQEEKELKVLISGIESLSDEELIEKLSLALWDFCDAIIGNGEVWQAQFKSNDPEVKILLKRADIQVNKKLNFTSKLKDAYFREKEKRSL